MQNISDEDCIVIGFFVVGVVRLGDLQGAIRLQTEAFLTTDWAHNRKIGYFHATSVS